MYKYQDQEFPPTSGSWRYWDKTKNYYAEYDYWSNNYESDPDFEVTTYY